MKDFFIIILFAFFSVSPAFADRVSEYIDKCTNTGFTDEKVEEKLIQEIKTKVFFKDLDKYYNDSVVFVRWQAYDLTYRKGLHQSDASKTAVSRLLAGIQEDDMALRSTIYSYLEVFPPASFTKKSREIIINLLDKPTIAHYERLVLLAGYLDIGKNELYQQFEDKNISESKKWNITLALARLGSEDALAYCLDSVKNAQVNSAMISKLLSGLIYTRQKQALDYCFKLIVSDEKRCKKKQSNKSDSIPCAILIVELIAPVIMNFPIQIDEGKGSDVNDYDRMLEIVRLWHRKNDNFKIRVDTF